MTVSAHADTSGLTNVRFVADIVTRRQFQAEAQETSNRQTVRNLAIASTTVAFPAARSCFNSNGFATASSSELSAGQPRPEFFRT